MGRQDDPAVNTPDAATVRLCPFELPSRLSDTPSPPAERTTPEIPGYALEGELGRGGMGVVYKARQLGLNRPVALKVVLAGGHAAADDLARFVTEAETAAGLQHHGIAQVFGVGHAGGLPYLAMEYVPGGTLADRLADGPLPPAVAVRLIVQLAEAVAYAHECGVVHRDLKPANVLLTADGSPKLTDFGVARRVGGAGLTNTGEVVGTPQYMAPEQALGRSRQPDPATDIYALGAVLYECLTGRPPVPGGTPAEVMANVLNRTPARPTAINRLVPRDLETVALKCLEKEPASRYPSAAALAADLRRYEAGLPVTARRVGAAGQTWRWAKRHPAIAGLIGVVFALLATVAGGAVAAAVRVDDARREAEAAYSREADARLAADESAAAAAAARDDARRQVTKLHLGTAVRFYDTNDPDAGLLWHLRAWADDPAAADNEADHRLRVGIGLAAKPQLVGLAVHDAPLADARIDAAGKLVLTRTATGRVTLWDIRNGRTTAELAHPGGASAIALDPAGGWAVTAGADGIARVWDAAGRLLRSVSHGEPVEAVAVHPTEPRFATAGGTVGVKLWDRDTARPVEPAPAHPGANGVVYSPDGRKMATTATDGTARVWDTATGQPLTPPLPFAAKPGKDRHWHDLPSPVFSPDGRRVVTTDRQPGGDHLQAVVPDADTGATVWTWPARRFVASQSFEPTGQRLLACGPTATLLDAATGSELAVMPAPRQCQTATFVGKDRVVTASTGGRLEVWTLDGNKATFAGQTAHAADTIRLLTGLPDGRHLFVVAGDGTARLYDLGPARPRPMVPGRMDRIAFKTDGKWLALSPDAATECVYDPASNPVIGPARKKNHPVRLDVTGVKGAKFSRDGSAVGTATATHARLWAVATGRPLGPPVAVPAGATHGWALSKDGSRAVVSNPAERTVHVFDMIAGTELLTLRFDRPLDQTLNWADLSSDGRLLVTGDFAYSGAVEVWEVAPARRVARFFPHRGELAGLGLSADGGQVLVSSSDTLARMWHTTDGSPAGPPLRHAKFCRAGELSADGRRAATVDSAGAVYLWDAASGDRLGRWAVPVESVGSGAKCWFTPDGRGLGVAGADRSLRRLDISPFAEPKERLGGIAELVTGRRLDPATGGIDFLPADAFQREPAAYLAAWRAWRGQPAE